MKAPRMPMIAGEALMTSPLFSNKWTLAQNGATLAALKRFGRIYVSSAVVPDLGRILIEPCGQGTVRAVDAAGDEVGRITRESWLGRFWDVAGPTFRYELVSDHRPRRWHFAVANASIAELEGSLVSYNHVKIATRLAIPVPAVLLAWHVIARPWEAAAEPRGLIPASAEPAPAA